MAPAGRVTARAGAGLPRRVQALWPGAGRSPRRPDPSQIQPSSCPYRRQWELIRSRGHGALPEGARLTTSRTTRSSSTTPAAQSAAFQAPLNRDYRKIRTVWARWAPEGKTAPGTSDWLVQHWPHGWGCSPAMTRPGVDWAWGAPRPQSRRAGRGGSVPPHSPCMHSRLVAIYLEGQVASSAPVLASTAPRGTGEALVAATGP